MASQIMDRIYKYQFVRKRPTEDLQKAKTSKSHLIFEFYRQKLINLALDVPEEIPKSLYETSLPVKREAAFNALLVKEIARYNVLLAKIRETLHDTRACLEGHS